MSFHFNFSNASDVSLNDCEDDSDVPQDQSAIIPPPPAAAAPDSRAAPPRFHTLEELLSTLPPNISYNTLTLNSNQHHGGIRIPRRELYDVKMQLMDEDDDLPGTTTTSTSAPPPGAEEKERDALLQFINGHEDVRRGVYEGGLKSWEGSVDLVMWLSSNSPWGDWDGRVRSRRRILELGCGTSLPSLYLFQEALKSASAGGEGGYTFHLADYNYSVLRLVTLPNLFLSWVLSCRPELLLTAPANGDVEVSEELKGEFVEGLRGRGISLGFVSGAWGGEMVSLLREREGGGEGYDLVMGSETIYEPATMGEFTKVLLGALTPGGRGLVSAKRIYFGVGGSVGGFVEGVRGVGGGWSVEEVESVGRERGGVGGVILEVRREG